MAIYNKETNIKHVYYNTQLIKKLYKGSTEIFTNVPGPTISSLTINPTTIDLDTYPSGLITLSYTTTAQLSELRLSDSHGNKYNVSSTTTTTISQPNIDTTYYLTAINNTGATQKSVSITITQNPQILNFRTTGYTPVPYNFQLGHYRFKAQIRGYPQPVLTFTTPFDSTTITTRHLTYNTRATAHTWDFSYDKIIRLTPSQRITLTAVNSSGSVTSTIDT